MTNTGNQRFKYLVKNMRILVISNFASKILVFLLVPLYTSVLSTTEYGTYDLVVSTVTLLYPILTLNIVDAVMRFSMDKAYSKNKIASIGIKYISFSICVIAAFLLIIYSLEIWQDITGLEVYIGLYYASYVLNQFFIQFAKGLERVADMGIAGVLGTVTMLGTNVLFLLVLRWGIPGFFAANILAQAIPTLYFFIRLNFWKYILKFENDKTVQKEMLLYCVPLIATALGWWVNSAAAKYVVTLICGLAFNGILSVSYKIPQILNTLQGIFIQAWQISAIKEYGEKDTAHFYGATFSVMNVFMSAACACLILLSKPIAEILYANDFYAAWQYVPFLLIASVFNSASGFIGPILSAKKDSKSMAMSAVYGSLINVVLSIVLVYTIGVQGATIATVISSFIIYYYRKQAVKAELEITNYWIVCCTWLLLVVQAIIEIYFSAWYLEIGIMAVLLILNLRVIIEAIKLLFKKKH